MVAVAESDENNNPKKKNIFNSQSIFDGTEVKTIGCLK